MIGTCGTIHESWTRTRVLRRAPSRQWRAEQPAWRATSLPIRIGISSCLLGEAVRFDGGHKRDGFVTGVLAPFVSFVPVCPEVEIGLGIPREAIRLVGDSRCPAAPGTQSGADHTEAMNRHARARVRALGDLDLSGYILKRGSPSCGMERVRVTPRAGCRAVRGAACSRARSWRGCQCCRWRRKAACPTAPARQLHHPRVRAPPPRRAHPGAAAGRGHRRLPHRAQVPVPGPQPEALRRGSAASSPGSPGGPRGALARAIRRRDDGRPRRQAPATKKHVNVLQHIAGFFKDGLGPRGEAGAARPDRRLPDRPRASDRAHHPAQPPRGPLRRRPTSRDQVYLRPHPRELMLRNHV